MSEKADEFLAHMGVVGMKWGKHKAGGDSSSGSAKEPKLTSKEKDKAIADARDRQQVRATKLDVKAFQTYTATSKKAQVKANEAYDRAAKQILTNPDAATAAKMTSGEKVATGLIIGVYGAMAISAIGMAAVGNRRL